MRWRRSDTAMAVSSLSLSFSLSSCLLSFSFFGSQDGGGHRSTAVGLEDKVMCSDVVAFTALASDRSELECGISSIRSFPAATAALEHGCLRCNEPHADAAVIGCCGGGEEEQVEGFGD